MIGYYVQHGDLTHRRRFHAVAEHLQGQLTGLGSGGAPDGCDVPWVELPTADDPGPATDPTAGGLLHHAPLRHTGVRERMARLTGWLHENDADVLVVDRSVEVTLAARLLGVPTVLIAGRGHRDDRAHRLGYDAATAIVAPWQRATHPAWPSSRTDRTHFVGTVSRYDGHEPHLGPVEPCGAAGDGSSCVTLVIGRGRHDLDTATAVANVVEASPGWCWHVIGDLDLPPHPRVIVHDPSQERWPLLCHSRVVIGPCDDGLLDDVAAARARFLALPRRRTSPAGQDEATWLVQAGLVAVAPRGTRPHRWPQLLEVAADLDPAAWEEHHDGRGAARLARLLETFALGALT